MSKQEILLIRRTQWPLPALFLAGAVWLGGLLAGCQSPLYQALPSPAPLGTNAPGPNLIKPSDAATTTINTVSGSLGPWGALAGAAVNGALTLGAWLHNRRALADHVKATASTVTTS